MSSPLLFMAEAGSTTTQKITLIIRGGSFLRQVSSKRKKLNINNNYLNKQAEVRAQMNNR